MISKSTPFSTLPTIGLTINELTYSGTNLRTGGTSLIGQAYLFDAMKFSEERASRNENIDNYFQEFILQNLRKSNIKSKVLVYYEVHQDFFSLYVCSKNPQVQWNWLASIKECSESGQNYLPGNSAPYIFWDGVRLLRLHKILEPYTSGSPLVSDFGALTGLTTDITSWENYTEIDNHPGEYSWYSPVPRTGRKIHRLHNKLSGIVDHVVYTME